MLFEVLMAMCLEKRTVKDHRNTSLPSSQKCRHSMLFNPPFGRFHSSNSHTVPASSVRLSPPQGETIRRFTSNSSVVTICPQKINAFARCSRPSSTCLKLLQRR